MKDKHDGRFRLEFNFSDNGLGWLVTDNRSQAEAWFTTFSQPFRENGLAERIVSIVLFDDNRFVKEFVHETVAA